MNDNFFSCDKNITNLCLDCWMMKAPSKVMRAYTQSGQYHIIVESRVHLTWY